MSNQAANHLKYLIATQAIDFSSDVFNIILMKSTFLFNRDTHHNYADVIADELGAGFGYLAGGNVLGGVAVTEDDANDRCSITWNNSSWLAAGGAIGPVAGAIIFDDTEANDAIVGYIDFGAPYSQADGGTLTINNPEVRIN